MARLFGTDGVRGVANAELTAKLAFDLGYSGARVLAKISNKKTSILIGRDTRISCDMLEAAIVAGICSAGAEAVTVGVVPTPAIAYLTARYKADAGVVISASHNSFEFNGIKFFDNRGYKLPDAIEDEIEVMIKSGEYALPTGAGVGRLVENPAAREDYAGHLLSVAKCDLGGIKIALDCANGAAYQIAPELFRKLGAEVYAFHCEPDGVNINAGCGSTHIAALRAHVMDCGADIGFAFDGDADRMIAVDELGNVIDGDITLALLALDMKKRGALPNNTVVSTVMSNIGLELAVKSHGIKLVRTAVGDRYVLEEMLKNGYRLGGENSGHIICLDANTTGDGIFAALQLLITLYADAPREGRAAVSELTGIVKAVPQIIRNARVANERKETYLDDPVIRERCSMIEVKFNGEGRVLIRPSGTEPLIRVMIESNDKDLIEAEADGLARLIEERLA